MLERLKRAFRSKQSLSWEESAMASQAAYDDLLQMYQGELEANAWIAVQDHLPPANVWVLTKREGEPGWNVCCWVGRADEDEVEWVEQKTGRTTVTHHSFAAPTHWKAVNL